jgi:hypothetical protein
MKNLCLKFMLLFLAMPFFSQAHQEAVFKIYEVQQDLKIQMLIGEHHVIDAIEIIYPFLKNTPTQEELDDCIAEYIDNNLNIEFNKKQTAINYQTISSEEGYLILEGQFDISPKEVQSASVNNTVLVADVPHHSNIIQFELNGHNRSFRLSKDRKETFIDNL